VYVPIRVPITVQWRLDRHRTDARHKYRLSHVIYHLFCLVLASDKNIHPEVRWIEIVPLDRKRLSVGWDFVVTGRHRSAYTVQTCRWEDPITCWPSRPHPHCSLWFIADVWWEQRDHADSIVKYRPAVRHDRQRRAGARTRQLARRWQISSVRSLLCSWSEWHRYEKTT